MADNETFCTCRPCTCPVVKLDGPLDAADRAYLFDAMERHHRDCQNLGELTADDLDSLMRAIDQLEQQMSRG